MRKTLLVATATFALLLCYSRINAKENYLNNKTATPKSNTSQVNTITHPATAGQLRNIAKDKSICFIENKGQLTDQYGRQRTDIDYKLQAGNLSMFIGDAQLHYQWSKALENATPAALQPVDHFSALPEALRIATCRMDVALLGANKDAVAIPGTVQHYYENYMLQQCAGGVTAHSYQTVTYKNVYPNIDWVIYTAAGNKSVKYDFIVRTGGDASAIRLQYKGATGLKIKDGNLTATTAMGSITENAPYTYYADTKEAIPSSFVLKGNVLSYKLKQPVKKSTAQQNHDIVIDPTIAWCTYYGNGNEYFYTGSLAACDDQGYISMAGTTASTSHIATTGAYQDTLTDDPETYIVKFNTNCQRIWGTYYGGKGRDFVRALTCDRYGNIFIAGTCNDSTALASIGAHQTVYGSGSNDGFIAKFNTSGIRCWGSYYGGEDGDDIWGVTTDTIGNVYVCGNTASTTGIATVNGFQTGKGGDIDGFFAKFDSSGKRQWASYYGDTELDNLTSVAVDKQGDIYIGGNTASTNNMTTAGSYQPGFITTLLSEGLLAKFTNSGTRLWATYVAGGVNNINIDVAGDIYFRGNGGTDDSIATPGTFQQTRTTTGNCSDIMKFSNAGQRIWGTYYNNMFIRSLTIDAYGHVYVAGLTNVRSGMATLDAYLFSGYNTFNFNDDVFASFDSATGQRLYASYMGDTYFAGVTADKFGNLYVYGHTDNDSTMSTPNAHQPKFYGTGNDAYLAKFTPTPSFAMHPIDTTVCPNTSFNVSYVTKGSFDAGNIFTAQLSDPDGSFLSPVAIGSLPSRVSGTIPCSLSAVTPGNSYRVRIVSTKPYTAVFSDDSVFKVASPVHTLGFTASDSNALPGTAVTFAALDTNGGSSPSYKWTRNGALIAGATSDTLILSNLNDNDVICVEATSSAVCAIPKSVTKCYTVKVATSVNDISRNNMSIYPNPADKQLTIETPYAGLAIQLLDVYGREIYKGITKAGKTIINTTNFSAGNYILQLTDGSGIRSNYKIVKDR